MQHARTALLALALAGTVGACAFTPPPVEEVLRPELPSERGLSASLAADAPEQVCEPDALEQGLALLVRVKAAARDALAAAEAAPDSADAPLLAARRLFEAAEVRLSCALLEQLRALEQPSVERVLNAEESVEREVAEELVSLALEGCARAERTLELAPENGEALLLRATLLSIETFGLGTVRALLSGRGPETWNAVQALRDGIDQGFDQAAPLRLRGRVLTLVPWPHRNLDAATRHLEDAVERAPVPLNWLYLGDTQARKEELEAARRAWEAVLVAQPVGGSAELAPVHRALARERLRALGG